MISVTALHASAICGSSTEVCKIDMLGGEGVLCLPVAVAARRTLLVGEASTYGFSLLFHKRFL